MERMLRKKKDNSDYEIDRELTGKFAIEMNAEYQDRIAELEEENKKLKEEIKSRQEEVERFKQNAMRDMNEITELEIENKKLKSDLSECECSMHFENDEVGYRKRECKKLKEELSKLKEKYGDIDY